MANKFTAEMDEIIRETNERMIAVMRYSIQDVINDAQTPGPLSKKAIAAAIDAGLGSSGRGKKRTQVQGPITAPGKGGRMRVDTGFLRASGQMSFNGMPTGPLRGDPEQRYEWDGKSFELQLAGLEIGMIVYFGWTAAYAAAREARDGFMAGAAQKWQSFVDKRAAELRNRLGG